MIMNDFMAKPVFNGDGISYCMNKYIEEKKEVSQARNIIYLDIDNAHRMVKRFLDEKRITKRELANLLDVTVRNLDQLFSEKIPPGLMSKVNLPLVRLYCSTKW